MKRSALLVIALVPLLAGCVVGAAVDVAKAPFKAAGKAVDLVTTSETERDAKFVRDLRKACEDWEDDVRKARRKDRPEPPPPNGACSDG
ncbi:MAG: hypothetical protein V2J26_06060 [Pacificimonas sp.]|jgi:hypothetical protein|nr:hypothetical protein [Pacificimonas sp.]